MTRPRPRRSRTETREETRRRLLDAAAEEFTEHGFAGASLEAISARAGYTRGAFHWHFKSKEELLVAVLRERLSTRIGATAEVVQRSSSAAAFNLAQRDQAAKVPFRKRRGWTLLMLEFWLHVARNPALLKEGRRLKSELRESVESQTEQLLNSIGVTPPLPVDLIASALLALEDGFALQELLDPKGQPSSRLWDVLDFFAGAMLGRES